MLHESLSFTLRRVDKHDDLMKVCAVRAEAYGRKTPAYKELMATPDAVDMSPATTLFLCEDKRTGNPVGSMRIQASVAGQSGLEIEKYAELPPKVSMATRAEITRLSSIFGADPFVRLALWKAGYLVCVERSVGWLVMGVRKPSLLRAYEEMGARDIHEDRRGVALAYAGNLPHRIFVLDVADCPRFWQDNHHPLLEFMVGTIHVDIDVAEPSMGRETSVQVGLHIVQ